MPPENPYAAPQVIDQPVMDLPVLTEELHSSLDSIRDGARLSLKSLWLTLLTIAVVAAGFMLPEIRDLVVWGMWLLLGSAAFCFLIAIVVWYRIHPAAGIRGLMVAAATAYLIVLFMSLAESWLTRGFRQPERIAWIATNNLLSMIYFVSYLWAAKSLGTFVNDRTITRSATVAVWSWGIFYAVIAGFYLLALIPQARDQLQWLYTAEGRPIRIANMIILSLLALVGLGSMIRALWRLRKIAAN